MQIFFFEKQLKKKPFQPSVNIPVDKSQVVARDIVPVVSEVGGNTAFPAPAFAFHFPIFGCDTAIQLIHHRTFLDNGQFDLRNLLDLLHNMYKGNNQIELELELDARDQSAKISQC